MSKRKKLRKIAFWSVLFLLCNLTLYMIGEHSLHAKIAFRKAERKNLTGPAEIVEVLDFEDSRYDHLLIGKSEYGYSFYEWQDNDRIKYYANFSYQPKGERATLYCTEYDYESLYTGRAWLPIFAFTEDYTAVSAHLTLTIDRPDGITTYDLETNRTQADYFLFRLKIEDLGAKDFWMIQQMITGAHGEYILEGTASAELCLYDRNGVLIETISFT